MENENNINLSSINWLFAKYYKPNYFSYTINSIDNFKIITKDVLLNILEQLGCRDYLKLEYLTQRYLSFVYDVKSKQIVEFESDDEDEVINIISELKKTPINPKKSLKEKWNELFKTTHSSFKINVDQS